jgi:hypothetical protein
MSSFRTPFIGPDMQAICKRVMKGIYQNIPPIYSNDLASVIRIMLQLQ